MKFTPDVLQAFPGICIAEGHVRSVHIERESPGLEALKMEIVREIKSRFTLDQIKSEPLFRAYRDFFWSVGVDPTKTRPASEALVRRILSTGRLPTINTAVDAFNLASVRTGIPIAAFDADSITGDLVMRFAHGGETFLGIGMDKPIVLRENQVVLTDSEQTIAIYPYRDSDATKVDLETRNILIIICGVPKVDRTDVALAFGVCAGFLEKFTGGASTGAEAFPAG